MTADREPVEIERLTRLNPDGPDDIFICCASFEDRCLSSTAKMGNDFWTKYAIIFIINDPLYQKQVETNSFKLQSALQKQTSKGIFVISCQKEDPVDGISQLQNIWDQCKPGNSEEPSITIDISGFTKIYLLELLHYLMSDLNLGMPRLIHTTQTYSSTKLTKGTMQITTVPNFYGSPSLDKQTALVLFLGFDPERALAVWKHFNPAKTTALITNPPRYGNPDYVKYARENNSYLLEQPSVEARDMPPDNPHASRNVLETIYKETKDSFNMVIGPFGTKPQAVGLFLFCLEHPKVQVVYSFPVQYTKSYLQRKPGTTLLLPPGL